MTAEVRLDAILGWLYGHVHPDDLPKLSHRIEHITAAVGPDQVFQSYTAIVWSFDGREHHASLSSLLSPLGNQVTAIAVDMVLYLGVRFTSTVFDQRLLEDPRPEVSWVGAFWAEKSQETKADCYHPRRSPSLPELPDGYVRDEGDGVFVLRSASRFFISRYVWWEKQPLGR